MFLFGYAASALREVYLYTVFAQDHQDVGVGHARTNSGDLEGHHSSAAGATLAVHVGEISLVRTSVTRLLHGYESTFADAKIATVLAVTPMGACKGARKSCHCIIPQFPFHYVIIG